MSSSGQSSWFANLNTWQKTAVLLTCVASLGGAGYYLMLQQQLAASTQPTCPRAKKSTTPKKGTKPVKKVKKVVKGESLPTATTNSSNESLIDGSSDAAALKEEGNKAFKQQDYPKALDYYTQAIELAKKGDDAKQLAIFLANRAACHGSLKNWEQVIADCDEALQADAKYVKCFLRRASAKFQLGQFADAAVDYLTICAMEGPTSSTTQANMVKVEECAVTITKEEVKKIIENRGDIGLQLPGHPYVSQQFLQYQQEYLSTEELSSPPTTLEAGDKLLIEAVKQLSAYDYDKTAQTVQKIVKEEAPFANPLWQAKAYNLYATFLLCGMHHDAAITYLNKSLALAPEDINSLLKLGSLLTIKESAETGQPLIDKAAALAGEDNPDVAFARATMLADSGDMENAIALYEKTYKMDESRTLPLLMLIGIHSVTGNTGKAEAAVRRAVRLFPEDADVQSTRAELCVRENKLAEALEVYDKAISLVKPGQKKPALYIGKATVHMMQGQFEEAETFLNKSIEIDPKFDQTYELLYRGLMSRGELQRALDTLDREKEVFVTFADESKLTEIIAAKHFLTAFKTLVDRQPDLKDAVMVLLNNAPGQ